VNAISRGKIATRRSTARSKAKLAKDEAARLTFKRPERGKKRQTGGEDAGGHKQTKYATKREAEIVKLESCEEVVKKGSHVHVSPRHLGIIK
jgi:hypothetical protein